METFATECTTPPEGIAFVGAPRIRGTLNIVWSCALVLVACTWSVLHLNVPVQSTLEPGNKWQKYRRTLLRTWTKVKWMLWTLLAPEYALGKAFSDYLSTRRLRARFETLSKCDGVPWTETHTHFANMGGFAIKFTPVANTITDQEDNQTESELQDWPGSNLGESISAPACLESFRPATGFLECSRHQSLDAPITWRPEKKHYAFLERIRHILNNAETRRILSLNTSRLPLTWSSWVMGEIDWEIDRTNAALVDLAVGTLDMGHFESQSELRRFHGNCDPLVRNIGLLKGNLWVVDANQLLVAREFGIINKLPSLAPDDLDDRNKQDLFLKLLAVGQIIWFIIEISVRWNRHLSISLLELMVFAFAVCTVITYLSLLEKPNNATYTIKIPATRYPRAAREITRLALVGPMTAGSSRKSIWIPNNATHLDYDMTLKSTGAHVFTGFAAAASVFIFGAIHCIGWNYKFPTDVEKVMWHASSVITAVAIPTAICVSSFFTLCLPARFAWPFQQFIGGTFVAARIFILVEVFRSLAYLAPDVFITTWASEIPHG